ncbi:MAG: hypothetical protein J6M19_00180, partial [Bacteroidaceae bacterium]|nr:hypothetical protein [Bacteroidaceae bacterium]
MRYNKQNRSVWRVISLLFIICHLSFSKAFAQSWPVPTQEAKAGARWWWLGSAVDKENLQWNISEYAKHGIGALEITPLYGVQGNEANNIDYLSDKWMEMLRFTQAQAKRNGIELDMATGTGWPFGGPWVPLKESACRVVFVEKTIDSKDADAIDLSPSEKDGKNAFLDKVMLYADGKAIDVTAFVNDGQLMLDMMNPLTSLLSPLTPQKVIAIYL